MSRMPPGTLFNALLGPQSITLNWERCEGNRWCSLARLNLEHAYFRGLEGVYVIWSTAGKWIRVGQGLIADRLRAHRSDPALFCYGELLVSWAQVSTIYRDRVERYLGNTLKPLVGSAFPNVLPLVVNLPS